MRTGVTVSASAHAVVLLVAIIGLSFPQKLTPDAEQSIAVDLVPLADTANARAGNEQSKVVDTKTPSVVQSNKLAVPDQPTGNTDKVQPKPAKSDTPSPMPTTSTAPAPAPQPAPVVPVAKPPPPAPAPQPAPAPAPEPKPQPKDTSAPTPLSQLATDTSTSADSANDTPTPAAQAASIAAKRAELKKQQDAAAAVKAAQDAAAAKAAQAAINKAIADADAQAKADAAKAAKAAAAAQAAADAKAAAAKAAQVANAAKAAKAADEISNLINDQKSTGAKTGAGGSPSLGKPTGTAATLSKDELAALGAQIGQCWKLLPSEIDSGLSVELLFDLNKDGTVSGVPKVMQSDSSGVGQSIARAAQRAVLQCGPYKLDASKYASWSQVDVTLMAGDQ